MTIPYEELDISARIRQRLEDSPSPQARLALATGAMCGSDKEILGLCVLLAGDADKLISNAAKRTLNKWDVERIRGALHRHTHAKILEYIIEFLQTDDRLQEEVFRCINLNTRTAKRIAKSGSERVCEDIAKNRQQLLLNPDLILSLQKNPNCAERTLASVATFLKLQHALPEEYHQQSAEPEPTPTGPKPQLSMDLEAEIEAALSGKQSPSLMRAQGSVNFNMFSLDDDSEEEDDSFSFDFRGNREDEFSFDLSSSGTKENKDEEEEEERQSLEMMIANMSVGHRIKLAYRGNKEARSILIRDTNRSVAVAVVKSGRLTDGEVSSYAGNRNLSDDVIREITNNSEYVRKYPVKVALTNNPKTPAGVALSFINSLQKRDLQNLARNRNVSSVVSNAARKRYKDKFRKS